MNAHIRLEASVGAIVADKNLHARWLNTFSYLEYVGFRKIVKSQRAEVLTAEILTHALEEGRHALGLKKIALKIGGEAFSTYAPENMLCGDEAEDYFQNLDAACDEAFADRPAALRAKLVYCYVTWLVERRALQVYGVYKERARRFVRRRPHRRPVAGGGKASLRRRGRTRRLAIPISPDARRRWRRSRRSSMRVSSTRWSPLSRGRRRSRPRTPDGRGF